MTLAELLSEIKEKNLIFVHEGIEYLPWTGDYRAKVCNVKDEFWGLIYCVQWEEPELLVSKGQLGFFSRRRSLSFISKNNGYSQH